MKKQFSLCLSAFLAIAFLMTALPLRVGAASSASEVITTDDSVIWTAEQLQNARLSDADIPEVLQTNHAQTNDLVHRVRAAEDEYSLVYQKRDGTCQKFVFAEPVQYRDLNGKLRDKKTKTVSIGNDFTTTDTDVVIKMPKSLNNGVKLQYEGLNLKMKPIGLMSKNKTYYSLEGSSFRYADTYDSYTDILYTPTFTGVKCDIVLERYAGKSAFRFEVNTNGYRLENDESAQAVAVVDRDGNSIAYFSPIIAYDSAGSVSFGEIRVQEQNPGNKYILTIAVDESFLTNSETVYPVTIDPTTSVTSTKRANLEYLCVYSNGTSYSSSSTSGADLRVGTFSNGVIGRVLYRFNEISAKNLIKAELVQCVRTKAYLEPMEAYAYQGSSIWNSSSKYAGLNFTYSASPVMSVQYGSTYGTNTKYMRVDVTSFVNLCKTNPQTYSLKKGILLKNTYGEQSPEYSAMDSSVSITTTDTTATPSAACFSPYLMYTYEPYRIMLDAGHAAVSNPSGYHEGTRMWKLCQYLKSELQSLGYDVGVTRTSSTTDTPVAERGAMAAGYDMFLSLHSNAVDDSTVNRVVVIYDIYNKNQASIFANQIGNAVRDTMNSGGLNISSVQIWTRPLTYTNGGIYYNAQGLMENYYGVLRAAAATDCPLYYIIEHSFHTNAATASWLMSDSNLQALAASEAAAIDNYLNP